MRRQNGVIRLRLQHRMDRETELQIIRSAYAKRVMSAAGIRELRATFDKGGAERVTRLYRRDDLVPSLRMIRPDQRRSVHLEARGGAMDGFVCLFGGQGPVGDAPNF